MRRPAIPPAHRRSTTRSPGPCCGAPTRPGEPVVALPSLGGSLPLYLFREVLGAPTVSAPIGNHDNNQHAEDENPRLQNLFAGIETLRAVMRMNPAW